ncbi:MAG: MerR family transcriptional regulator [Chloroflexus sp.]|mgnify:FL=1|jgi:DNA-binding transcriptional MerR regulator|uniref:heavy metal-responsive transcriptional regulator n=2 Tax=Chloroflexus TaxID=1107 RepID=UPI000173B991|nr:heavy metal-responsive transcriptional regulator [Chloroflexus sp.]GIV87247.1 MAG: MerR family transcriptional regulator [Chloroflexus sp.]
MMRIGELARQTGVSVKTIRFYEQIGVLPPPPRMENNYRFYSPDMVDRLRFITHARSLGLSLREIAAILALSDRGEPPCGEMLASLDRQIAAIDQRIADLQELRTALIDLRQRGNQAATPWTDCICALVRDRQV